MTTELSLSDFIEKKRCSLENQMRLLAEFHLLWIGGIKDGGWKRENPESTWEAQYEAHLRNNK